MGAPHGGACSHNLRVDLTSARAYVTLGELHLDHEQDLVVTCDMWVQALAAPLPRAPATWDDGVDGALLCHLLFLVLQARGYYRLENVPGFPISEFFSWRLGVRRDGAGPESNAAQCCPLKR